jgi:hypothetical protein
MPAAAKPRYRQGCALLQLQRWAMAAKAFEEADHLEPGDKVRGVQLLQWARRGGCSRGRRLARSALLADPVPQARSWT